MPKVSTQCTDFHHNFFDTHVSYLIHLTRQNLIIPSNHLALANMRVPALTILLACTPAFSLIHPAGQSTKSPQAVTKHLRPVLEKRQQFSQGEPISAQGNGAPILSTYPSLLRDDDGGHCPDGHRG